MHTLPLLRHSCRKPLLIAGCLSLSLFASWLLADTVVPNNTTVINGQTYQVTDPGKITTGGAVDIQTGGKAAFVGGTSVTLSPGFHAANGALFRAAVDLNLGGFANLTDSDLDGLVDAWESLHFGSIATTTGMIDSDGDGVSNADEYYAGTNPMLNESTAGMPGGVQVIVKNPTGKYQGVTTQWAIVPAP